MNNTNPLYYLTEVLNVKDAAGTVKGLVSHKNARKLTRTFIHNTGTSLGRKARLMRDAGDYVGQQIRAYKSNAKAGQMLQKAKEGIKNKKYGFIDTLKGTKQKALRNVNASIADNARNTESIKSSAKKHLDISKKAKAYING